LEEFQNLVPELVCLVIWFQILIMLKVSSFGIFKSGWFTPENSQKFPVFPENGGTLQWSPQKRDVVAVALKTCM